MYHYDLSSMTIRVNMFFEYFQSHFHLIVVAWTCVFPCLQLTQEIHDPKHIYRLLGCDRWASLIFTILYVSLRLTAFEMSVPCGGIKLPVTSLEHFLKPSNQHTNFLFTLVHLWLLVFYSVLLRTFNHTLSDVSFLPTYFFLADFIRAYQSILSLGYI